MAPVFGTTEDRLDSLRGLPRSLPVLVIVGEQDTPFLGHSERMAASVGRATLAVIPDADRLPGRPLTWRTLSLSAGRPARLGYKGDHEHRGPAGQAPRLHQRA